MAKINCLVRSCCNLIVSFYRQLTLASTLWIAVLLPKLIPINTASQTHVFAIIVFI